MVTQSLAFCLLAFQFSWLNSTLLFTFWPAVCVHLVRANSRKVFRLPPCVINLCTCKNIDLLTVQ